MVVIGIDFGNDVCVVSVWQNGQIETVTNDSGFRYTPSIVSFSQRKREFGVSAKRQWSTNVANTIFDFKSILNVNLTTKWKFNLLKFTENPRDCTLSFDISFSGKKLNFKPYQVLAMLFAKIKADAEEFVQTKERIIGCVLAVPSYFNDQERKSVLMAAAIAGLDCHFLIKETTAVAINYSLYKKFPTPVNVIFIDFGQSSIQLSACKFSDRRLEVIEEASELIGGRDIDETLADHFIEACKIRGANKRSKIFSVQILDEVEKLKKKMSFSDDRLPLDFKQLFNSEPIFMQRTQMENVCADLFARVENLMRGFLNRSKLKTDEIHSIELVGGSSHIPIIGKLVEKVFGKAPISTMNRDEAVARGCLLKSIMNIKRKGYKIIEKPFNDINNGNFSGNRDLVRMFQVHRFLKCDCRDSFNVTEDEFIGFVEMEKKLAKHDSDEEKRRIAHKNLQVYLMEHTKPEGLLADCNVQTKKELHETMALHDGTKNQYVDLLYYWTQKVEKLKNRKRIPQNERAENDWDCSKEEQCDDDVVKKLTFNDCDEVKLVERCDDDRVDKSGLAALLRIRRKGVRNRHRRLNHVANESHSRHIGTSSRKSLFGQSGGQRKNRMAWCCFL